MAKKHKKTKAPQVNPRKQQRQQHSMSAPNPSTPTPQSPHPAPTANAKRSALPSDDTLTVRFEALDTWFFRESRPHDAVGASELSSLFPPPMRTLIGALRTFLGEQIGLNWSDLASTQLPDFDFTATFGDSENLGLLHCRGSWLVYQGQRLYPAPLYLMQQDKNMARLQPGKAVYCDLGRVRLPELCAGLKGYKALDQRWLTEQGWLTCLQGQEPDAKDIIGPEQLFTPEARLGIARDISTRAVQKSKLYQTRHLRLQPSVAVEIEVSGIPENIRMRLNPSAIIRLGGEGRMAAVYHEATIQPSPRINGQVCQTFSLHFVTPADFNGQLYPANFEKTYQDGQTVWLGELAGIPFHIESAVLGKVHREGGWDMQRHQPRPVKSLIPAGSVWFCRLAQKIEWGTLLEQLHGLHIGHGTAWGRGHIALGQWHDSHYA
ncbi:type III-B CRISPR module-associated Cmr3 family protein [Methylotuvimicrobium sp. KM2]|uniref:type III-B CRISPR module-associated Cmr3 family protein n=1 Tax=Methylotuvimicrobium sp. KM2 TaxID=3133976 RepID=UPI003100B969